MITAENFLRKIDEIAHSGEYYDENPELKKKCETLHPIIRTLYNQLLEQGWLTDESLEESKKRFSKRDREQDDSNFKIKKLPQKKFSKKVDIRTDFDDYDDEEDDFINEAVNKTLKRFIKGLR